MRRSHVLTAASVVTIAAAATTPSRAAPWAMNGTKQIALHTRDGKTIPIGTVDFQPKGPETSFKLHIDPKAFTVFFLSMRNFDCLDGVDVECFVPYPYPNPMTATATDLNWLADNLLFMFKTKAEFGANLNNGIRYDLKLTDHGIAGKPQAVDLNAISFPPKNTTVPPFAPADRDDYPDGSRWVTSLTIE